MGASGYLLVAIGLSFSGFSLLEEVDADIIMSYDKDDQHSGWRVATKTRQPASQP